MVPVSATTKFAPVIPTSASRKTWRSLSLRRPHEHLAICGHRGSLDGREELGDLVGRLLERGGDDVRRVLAAELEDVLAEIGLDDLQPGRLERGVELDLLGRHGLRLRNELRVVPSADLDDIGAGLLGGCADLDVPASRLERPRELLQVAIDVADGPHPDVVRSAAERLDVLELAPGLEPVGTQSPDRDLDRLLHPLVGQLAASDLSKAISRLCETGQKSIPFASAVAR